MQYNRPIIRDSMTMAADSFPDVEQGDDDRTVAIVLVGEEESFVDLFQRFSPRQYPLVFVPGVPSAAEFCRVQPPQLLILPLDLSPNTATLLELLRCARARQTRVIALSDDEPAAEVVRLLDRRIGKADTAALLAATSECLGERRAMPRVAMEVELTVSNLGEVTATVISGRSLYIPRACALKSGQMVQASLHTGHCQLRCWASVIRLEMGEDGPTGFVLAVAEKERDVRAYLDGLVRGMLLLERAETSDANPNLGLPEGLTKRLAERLAREVTSLRVRLDAQVALTDALNSRLNALIEADAKEVKWRDVRPALAQKWSAQRDLFRRLAAKVEGISANQDAAKHLRSALQEEDELQRRLEEQASIIETLRARLDQWAEGAPEADEGLLSQIYGAQREIEGTLGYQAKLIDDLSLRVERLSARRESSATAEQVRRTLEDHSVQITSLSLRLDELRDRIRMGEPDQALFEQLRQDLGQQQQVLRALEQPLADIEGGAAPEEMDATGEADTAQVADFEVDVPTRQQPADYPKQLFGELPTDEVPTIRGVGLSDHPKAGPDATGQMMAADQGQEIVFASRANGWADGVYDQSGAAPAR